MSGDFAEAIHDYDLGEEKVVALLTLVGESVATGVEIPFVFGIRNTQLDSLPFRAEVVEMEGVRGIAVELLKIQPFTQKLTGYFLGKDSPLMREHLSEIYFKRGEAKWSLKDRGSAFEDFGRLLGGRSIRKGERVYSLSGGGLFVGPGKPAQKPESVRFPYAGLRGNLGMARFRQSRIE